MLNLIFSKIMKYHILALVTKTNLTLILIKKNIHLFKYFLVCYLLDIIFFY